MRKKNRIGKRLRLVSLILGGYGVFLGLGLVAIGLAEMKEGIGIIRILLPFAVQETGSKQERNVDNRTDRIKITEPAGSELTIVNPPSSK